MSYFNTTNETGDQLEMFAKKAENQDEAVLSIYQLVKEGSPSQIHRIYGADQCPITSIRRSITNLCKAGSLVMTEGKVKGLYGRPEHVWKLKIN